MLVSFVVVVAVAADRNNEWPVVVFTAKVSEPSWYIKPQ